MTRLDRLLDPAGVAVLGATDREGSVGRAILENLDRTFDGRIVPINPNRAEVLGYACPDSIEEAPAIDLAVVVLPADAVLSVLSELADAGVQEVVVISAGFGEVGSGGSRRERELVAIAEEHDMTLIGPNSLGVMSTPSGLNATFAPAYPPTGSVSMLSQSGAFITAILDWAVDADLGYRHVVSLGNEAVIDETDVLESWAEDPETSIVMGYLEEIDDGRRFIDVVREVTRDTPVVLVKSGRTAAGSRAASSHTGSIAGDDAAYAAGLDQAGVIRVTTTQELLDATRAFAHLPEMAGEAVAVVTNAGGPGVMATDAVGDAAVRLAEFTDSTLDAYEALLPADASIYNPVDILGDADAERFAESVQIAIDDDHVAAVLVVIAPTGVLSFADVAERLVEVGHAVDKPVVVCALGGERSREATRHLESHGIPSYPDPARAVFGLDVLARYRAITTRTFESPRSHSVDRAAAHEIISSAIERERPALGLESIDLLDAYGIPTAPGELATHPDAASRIAERLDGPIAMKIVSPDITHKSDIGGVELDVDPGDIRDAHERIVTNAQNYRSDAAILGVYVQEMVDLGNATETIVGATRDPQFGPMLLFGLGGIFVETLEDTTIRIAPISEREAREMIDGIAAAPLLRGARGRPAADLDAIVETLERLSQLMIDHPRILELDVNPLVAGPDDALAIDFRATIDTEDHD